MDAECNRLHRLFNATFALAPDETVTSVGGLSPEALEKQLWSFLEGSPDGDTLDSADSSKSDWSRTQGAMWC